MSRQICPLVDSNGIYWYLRKVRKNSASCVFLRWLGREVSVRQVGFGSFLGQVKLTGQTCFRNRSLLAGAGNTRIGARAFPTLEGLCGPESTKRNWLLISGTTDHRRGSRLRVERRQTRSSYLGLLCVFGWLKCHSNPEQPERACAAVERDLKGLKGKELRFANI